MSLTNFTLDYFENSMQSIPNRARLQESKELKQFFNKYKPFIFKFFRINIP